MHETIQTQIERFLRTGEGDFDALALALFAYQFERNAPYQRYCRALGASPEAVRDWRGVPAVPAQAFKSAELTTFPAAQAAAVFHSSSTTGQIPSRHYLKTLGFYEASLKGSFRRWVLDDDEPRPFFILTPPPSETPRSSLVWMFDVVRRRWGMPQSDFYLRRGVLDAPRLARDLERAGACGRPFVLLGTTLSFLQFFEYCAMKDIRRPAPAGSRLLDTGGMKTEKRQVTREQFVNHCVDLLGLDPALCINEYGMSELSSQFYGAGRDPLWAGPPWTRFLVINPLTGEPAADGETGLLRHVDLANVDSVMAVQTEDLAVREGDRFRLLGRAGGAELRGCSLMTEAFTRSVPP